MADKHLDEALDMSNWWLSRIGRDTVTDSEALEIMAALKRKGIKKIIAGTQVPSVCYQQLSTAYRVGLRIEAYCQFTAQRSAQEQLLDARHAVHLLPIERLFIAAEDSSLLPVPDYIKAYNGAHQEAIRHDFDDRGVYTNKDNWTRLTGDSDMFRSLPLWAAHFGIRRLDAKWWRDNGFGGWWKPVMRQYAGDETFDTGIEGLRFLWIDRNVF